MEIPNLTPAELLAKWKHVLDATFDIFTWTSPVELCWLCEAASQARSIVEIGSYHGKSAVCMRLANPDPNTGITCLDIPESIRCSAILRANTSDRGIAVYAMTSAQFKFSGKRDFAFIDGGHLFDDVKTDIANLLPHMAAGAIISGHDWRHNNMDDGVNRGVLAHFKLEQIRFCESIWWVKLP